MGDSKRSNPDFRYKRTRLYELINDGTIKSIKLGGKRLVSYASIETLGSNRWNCLKTEP